MSENIKILLRIENIDIKSINYQETKVLITIESTAEGTHCSCCEKFIEKFHG